MRFAVATQSTRFIATRIRIGGGRVRETAALQHIDDVRQKERLPLICRRLLDRLGERITRQTLGKPNRGSEPTQLAFLVGLRHHRENLAALYHCELKHDENIG